MDRSFTIGVLIGNANSPHTMDLMQGIHSEAEKLGINVLFFLAMHSNYYYRSFLGEAAENDYDYQFNVIYDYAWLGHTDALIISYGSLGIFLKGRDKYQFLRKFDGLPYVLSEDVDETDKGTSLIADNYNGMYELVEHLVRDHGYRDFTYLAGPPKNMDAIQRKKAFEDVLRNYGIPFGEERVEYGDFSECVEEQANRLLDKFPQMEAMVCANDVMANTVYRECKKRGIRVGKDIAVTGYDDWQVAETMDPPLTTVLQNAYDMGHMAVICAVEQYKGKRPRKIVVPAHVKYRSSCGCGAVQKDQVRIPEQMIGMEWSKCEELSAAQLLQHILPPNSNDEVKVNMTKAVKVLFQDDFRIRENQKKNAEKLKLFLDAGMANFISPYTIIRKFSDYMDAWLECLMRYGGEQENTISTILELKRQAQDLLLTHMAKRDNEKYTMFQQEAACLPLIFRDMLNHVGDDREFYRNALIRLSALDIRRSFLYLLEKPVIHRNGEEWNCPDKLYLAAWQDGKNVEVFDEEERPVLSRESGFSSFGADGGCFSRCVFDLFAGETQYGILVTEIDPANQNLSYLISMQIGNALRTQELSKKQIETQKELEALVKEINEKNEVLNFISEYDALTGCLNRRGFVEKALHFNHENRGKEAFLIFADLDHLKEINDCFGHAEGDFAICHAADMMREAVDDRGFVGRIGGDEFVALILSGGSETGDEFAAWVKERNRIFNQKSDKAYYVELSMGYQKFACDENMSLAELLNLADRSLYENKKKRRNSIRK